MRITKTFAETRAAVRGRVGLVPTMGFLHEGHLSLIKLAAEQSDTVVMSLYVNPLQFDREDDLERYPRDLERDVELATAAGADIVFAPAGDEMYAGEQLTRVNVGALSDELEGPNRPGHFEGVATVVAKLFAGLQPDVSFFGRKDAQQLAIVKRMGRDLSFPGAVVGGPIVRETDGLALSSRNIFLSSEERNQALALHRGLMEAADLVEAGERSGAAITTAVFGEIDKAPDLKAEYVALASQKSVAPCQVLEVDSFLALAAWSGTTRLIDNVHFDLSGDGFVADRGIRLTTHSVLYGPDGPAGGES